MQQQAVRQNRLISLNMSAAVGRHDGRPTATAGDRELLEVLRGNQVSTHYKLDQIVTRLVRLKLHGPLEQTTRHILAVAMTAGLQRPTAKDALYNFHKE